MAKTKGRFNGGGKKHHDPAFMAEGHRSGSALVGHPREVTPIEANNADPNPSGHVHADSGPGFPKGHVDYDGHREEVCEDA